MPRSLRLLSVMALSVTFILFPIRSSATTERLTVGNEMVSWGSIEVDVPAGWSVARQGPDSPGGAAYVFSPPPGREFKLLVTPLPILKSGSFDANCAAIGKVTENARERLQRVAAETEIPILERSGERACLRYVSVTDKTVEHPSTKDWKYGMHGAAVIGRVGASFSLFTNVADAAQREAPIEILRKARHVGGPKDLTAPLASSTHLAYPGRGWNLVVDLSGFELEEPLRDDKRTGLRFAGERKDPWTMVTIFFEPADPSKDAKAYRAYYREKSFKAAPVQREDVRESDRYGMPVLEYTNILGKDRFANVNGFLVKDGLWVDIHVSTSANAKSASDILDRFLHSVRIEDGVSP